MIDRLDAAGCIKRISDSNDRRRVLIEPTKDGLARISAYYDGLTARAHDDLAVLRREDLVVLLGFIERSRQSVTDEIAQLRRSPDR